MKITVWNIQLWCEMKAKRGAESHHSGEYKTTEEEEDRLQVTYQL